MTTAIQTPTKAVMADVPQWLLEQRRRTGADIWDEMWDGVPHMPPMPTPEHQDFVWELETWLRHKWARARGCKVFHNVNVASIDGWPDDYRIPDIIVLSPDRLHIRRKEFFEGAPLIVVEIRSPRDESYENMKFYAQLGVPEVWIIERDTWTPQLYRLVEDLKSYEQVVPDADGWLHSQTTNIVMKGTDDHFLAIMVAGDQTTLSKLPEGDDDEAR